MCYLSIGVYNYTILVNDTSNNQATDLVYVTVSAAAATTTTGGVSTVTQDESTVTINKITPDPFPLMTDLVIDLQQNWFVILAGIAIIAVLYKKIAG